jgi:acetylcholinesterase
MDQYPLMAPLPFHNAWFPSASAAYGEATFICPNVNVLNSIHEQYNATSSINTDRVWGYRYNVVDRINAALGAGVPHIWESWAIFGPDSLNGVGGGPVSYYTYDAPIVPVVMNYWISFVRTLDPNALRYPSAPVWENWGDAKQRLMFDVGNTTMETTPDDLLDRCDLWRGLASVMESR